MNLCICTEFWPSIGGIETLAEILAYRWADMGHRVTIVTDVPSNPSKPRHFPFTVLHRPRPMTFLATVRRCDLFVQNNISLKAVWPLLIVRRPFVAVHHGYYVSLAYRSWRDKTKLWISRRRAHNISVSRAVHDHFGAGGEVIPNSYDDSQFRVLNESRHKRLIFVGRLVSDKGADVLLRTLIRLRANGITPSLTIVGDGPERPRLADIVRQQFLANQVTLVGAKTRGELARLLNQHSILVIPSICDEGFGIVALEGAACGCVVVGSSGGGLPEAIGPCGVTFPNGDVEQLADVLATLLENEGALQPYRRAAPEHLARHSVDLVAKRYLDFFTEVVASSNGVR